MSDDFHDTDLFETIFYSILHEAITYGFVDPEVVFVDSTHVEALELFYRNELTRIPRRSAGQEF